MTIRLFFHLIFIRVLNASGGLHLFPMLKDDFEQKLSEGCDSPYLLSFLVDFYDDNLEIYGKDEAQVRRVIEVRAIYFRWFEHLPPKFLFLSFFQILFQLVKVITFGIIVSAALLPKSCY